MFCFCILSQKSSSGQNTSSSVIPRHRWCYLQSCATGCVHVRCFQPISRSNWLITFVELNPWLCPLHVAVSCYWYLPEVFWTAFWTRNSSALIKPLIHAEAIIDLVFNFIPNWTGPPCCQIVFLIGKMFSKGFFRSSSRMFWLLVKHIWVQSQEHFIWSLIFISIQSLFDISLYSFYLYFKSHIWSNRQTNQCLMVVKWFCCSTDQSV